MTKESKFRLLAAGIPTLIGLAIITVFLIKRENVVVKDGGGEMPRQRRIARGGDV